MARIKEGKIRKELGDLARLEHKIVGPSSHMAFDSPQAISISNTETFFLVISDEKVVEQLFAKILVVPIISLHRSTVNFGEYGRE